MPLRERGAKRIITPISSALPRQAAPTVTGIPANTAASTPFPRPYTIPYSAPTKTGPHQYTEFALNGISISARNTAPG